MNKNLEQFEDVKTFEDAEKMIVDGDERVKDLESLFRLWRRAHVLEVEEWKRDNKDKVKTWDNKETREIPETIPGVFKKQKDKEVMEEVMKYSFCGDGYIGTSDPAKAAGNSKDSNGEPNKFTRFFILKEENIFVEKDDDGHVQRRGDLEKEIQPYNTYYGDWAYGNRKVLEKTATATTVANVARYICAKEKKNFKWRQSCERDVEATKAIKKFAIINLNKRGGSGKADESALASYVTKYEAFILKEIELLASEEKPLEFVFFGKQYGEYFIEMKKKLKAKSHNIYNLPHPARMSYKKAEEKWNES